jgi:hypothetical protein
MEFNFWINFVAALVPLVIGFIWYHPKVLGTKWMEATGMTEEKAKGANMVAIFGLTYLFSLFLTFMIQSLAIHQIHVLALLSNQPDSSNPNSEAMQMLKKFMELFGTSYRTFKHGAFHGTLAGIMMALPIIGINALFERRGFKYIAINTGYFIVTFALMGGILCAFS